MPYKLEPIRNVARGVVLCKVNGEFPVKFGEFVRQILSEEHIREVTFTLPSKDLVRQWGVAGDSVVQYGRANKNIWIPTARHSDEWYSKIRNEVVTSCTAYAGFNSVCYNFTIAEAATPTTKVQKKTQRVRVRCTTPNKIPAPSREDSRNLGDTGFSNEDLVAMLRKKDQYIAQLHHDLSGAQEGENRWKSEAQRLLEENRRLRALVDEGEKPNRAAGIHARIFDYPEDIRECLCRHGAETGSTIKTTSIPKPLAPLVLAGSFSGQPLYICPHCKRPIKSAALGQELRLGVYLCPCCKNEVTRK